ncbi:hypothetical protein OKA05_07560 [Luteolibacter arcticus]|uniref:Uncharacterized protein n=1 Tax=Luteolibacter arcticus TaxID=1581411 RepID=A0ABT3GFK4_9BACT|nr:hypothetical protein [Luteolibacter arcticus]MCW1922406.1 hypothetical protein [Luteolibacter arcticus]
MNDEPPKRTSGFCVYLNTLFQGPVPTLFDENDKVCIFATEEEAQREIVDNAVIRLREFLDGERDFYDAISIEEYIVEVDVLIDGSILDADGNRFNASGIAE